MKKQFIFILLFYLFFFSAISQINLKPSIGLSSVPSDSDSICIISPAVGSPSTNIIVGDTVAHFKLFNKTGDSLDILAELTKKKPVLLISGSYTCPIFRNKQTDINLIYTTFSPYINSFIIYVIEPHPVSPDLSPYNGTVNTTSQNQSDGVLFRQPVDYGERKAILDSMNGKMTFAPPVFIDGPCNEWWHEFGTAPNAAYLIDTNGILCYKELWFNYSTLYSAINNCLGINVGIPSEISQDNFFNFYPNPADNSWNIVNNSFAIYSLEIFDAAGNSVLRKKDISEKNCAIDISTFAQGIYIYTIDNGSKRVNGKLAVY